LNADSFFHTWTRTIISLLSRLGCAAFLAVPILSRASRFAGRLPLSVTSACAAAPNPQFIFPGESHRAEDGAAPVADFTGENSVLCEELVTLLSREQHG